MFPVGVGREPGVGPAPTRGGGLALRAGGSTCSAGWGRGRLGGKALGALGAGSKRRARAWGRPGPGLGVGREAALGALAPRPAPR